MKHNDEGVAMASELSAILAAARDILAANKAPMHVSDIAAEAMRTNRNQQLSLEDFQKKLMGALAANVKTASPAFAKVASKTGGLRRGIYKLKPTRGNAGPKPPEPPPPLSTNFMGKAGEHAVMSELLFWGLNASLMAVDEGIDIVASKDNRYFHIQVKAASPSDAGRYTFTIKSEAFESNDNAHTFYIFVMRRRGGNDYAVIPSSHLRNLKSLGVIAGSNGLSISIAPDEKGRSYVMNRRDDITPFINNFSIIK